MKKIFVVIVSLVVVNTITIAQDPEAKLKEKGIVLSKPEKPVANYVNAVRVGNLIFLAGNGPSKPDGR